MSKFMFLFRNNPAALADRSPEQMQQLVQKWMGWMEALKKGGHAQTGGERLSPTGKVVRGHTKSITDGPFIEVKDAIQGYIMIEAKDLDEAVELSKGSPVYETDGSVEVRPIMSM